MKKILILSFAIFIVCVQTTQALLFKIEPGTKPNQVSTMINGLKRNTVIFVDLSNVDCIEDKDVLRLLLNHTQSLMGINVSGCKKVKFHFPTQNSDRNATLPRIAKQLNYVNVSGTGIDWVGLLNLADIFKSIKVLDLNGLNLTSDIPFYAPIIKMAPPAPLPTVDIQAPAPESAPVEQQTASTASTSDQKDEADLPEEVVAFNNADKDPVEQGPALPEPDYVTSSKFTVDRINLNGSTLNNAAAVLLLAMTPSTKHLNFEMATLTGVFSTEGGKLLPNRHSLSVLNLNGAKGFGDEVFECIKNCPLTDLHLANTPTTLKGFMAITLDLLKTLEITLCSGVGTKAYYVFGPSNAKLLSKSLPKLSKMIVRDDATYPLDDAGLVSLEYFTDLVDLDISTLKAVTHEGVKHFLTKRKTREGTKALESMRIPYLKDLTPTQIEEIAALATDLKTLSVNNQQLPRQAADAIKGKFPTLNLQTN